MIWVFIPSVRQAHAFAQFSSAGSRTALCGYRVFYQHWRITQEPDLRCSSCARLADLHRIPTTTMAAKGDA